MRVSYGIEVDDPHHELVVLEENLVKTFTDAFIPGKYLVEALPLLRHLPTWFPGTQFHKDAAAYKKVIAESLDKPFNVMLNNMVRCCVLSSLALE